MNTIYILFFIAGIQRGGAGFVQEFPTQADCETAKAAVKAEIRPRLDTEVMMLQCLPKGGAGENQPSANAEQAPVAEKPQERPAVGLFGSLVRK